MNVSKEFNIRLMEFRKTFLFETRSFVKIVIDVNDMIDISMQLLKLIEHLNEKEIHIIEESNEKRLSCTCIFFFL